MRLAARRGERIDRAREVRFSFDGIGVSGYEGDTIGSALYAEGQRIFSRSFKYHRPRGLLCCGGHCPNCLMTVDGVPNVRVCVEPLREGARVSAQNVRGSLGYDLMAVTDKIGGPFTPVGFYYRTMIRPRRAWPLFERFLRSAAGLGRVDKHARRARRFDSENRHVDVLVVGGGRAGIQAARAAAARGEKVVLADEGPELGESGTATLGFEVLAPARAIGIYEGNLVPVDAGSVLYRFRAGRIIVATGALEQPLLFPGNDLVGVMLPGAVRRLVRLWSVKPGDRAVVVAADERGLRVVETLQAAGTEVARAVDLRRERPREIVAQGRRGYLRSVSLDGQTIDCDLLVMSGGRQPAYSLLAQAGARIEYDRERGIFVPAELPDGVEAVGAVTGEIGNGIPPAASYNGAGARGKCFACLCEDVTDKDVKRAIAEGFDSIELAKRYTTVTMGPCQGKLCHLPSIRLYARETESGESEIGTTTARPPWTPVSLGVLAGRGHEPAKRTSIHHAHKDLGARMMWTGAWRRPHSYGDPEAEAKAVHETVGLIDVSTLGKLLVRGSAAGEFLERLYPNRFADLKPGRIRYGVLGTDGGRIMDDGTIARLTEETFYVTTTSTGADTVIEWFEWWNAVWRLDVEVTNVTGALAAVNVAGPRARDLLARLTAIDVSNDALRYLDAREATVAGVPALLLRIGFVGELGYELHVPSPYGEYLWETILDEGRDLGIRPFGLEPQRILRLEKMHILVGQDTDSESNALAASMPWIVKFEKDDFVGKASLAGVRERGFREQLVGFEMGDGVGAVPAEGGQIVFDGRPGGRITSSRWSPVLGRVIGMAWVPAQLAREGAEFDVKMDGGVERARVRLRPFYDPDGGRLRS
ncbi:MAG: 2Fe-2S iron-sulfur cluster-binding protein [Actinomycetota bacterium]|nr:2Fe-2S iron-sulfur cluster-binding protein [Actinomycetota bacterium]